MPKFDKLSDLSEKEFREYTSYLLTTEGNKAAKKIGADKLIDHAVRERATDDVWNLYRYGDVLKVVYIKTLPRHKTRERGKKTNVSGITADESAPKIPENLISDKFKKSEKSAEKEKQQRFSQSLSRTKARIFELAACNEFTYFCTFTQDEEKRDRFDLSAFRTDFAQLVRNMNRDRAEGAKIQYLLIPEKHKNGAWHMHGLLKGLTPEDLRPFTLEEKLPQKLRKQLKEGIKIYDWTRYRRAFGYFTCTEIENATAVSKYVTKYITKDLKTTTAESGMHLFFASQGLKSREVLKWRSFEKCPFEKWDFENDYVKVKELQISPETGAISD